MASKAIAARHAEGDEGIPKSYQPDDTELINALASVANVSKKVMRGTASLPANEGNAQSVADRVLGHLFDDANDPQRARLQPLAEEHFAYCEDLRDHPLPTRNLPTALRMVRQCAVIRQTELAEKSGVGHDSISDWEVSKRQPGSDTFLSSVLQHIPGVSEEEQQEFLYKCGEEVLATSRRLNSHKLTPAHAYWRLKMQNILDDKQMGIRFMLKRMLQLRGVENGKGIPYLAMQECLAGAAFTLSPLRTWPKLLGIERFEEGENPESVKQVFPEIVEDFKARFRRDYVQHYAQAFDRAVAANHWGMAFYAGRKLSELTAHDQNASEVQMLQASLNRKEAALAHWKRMACIPSHDDHATLCQTFQEWSDALPEAERWFTPERRETFQRCHEHCKSLSRVERETLHEQYMQEHGPSDKGRGR